MMNKLFLTLMFMTTLFLFSCGGSSDTDESATDSLAVSENIDQPTDEEQTTENKKIQDCGFPIESRENFLSYVAPEGKPKTFQSDKGDYMFFRADGTMAGGGNDGEGSMWEAKWEFKKGEITGQIIFTVTMEPGIGKALSGEYNVEMFPDDGALILNCVDYFETKF